MADIELIIKIPEENYKNIVKQVDKRDYPDMSIGKAIANGTPLPKGHGDLIDVSTLLTVTDIISDGSEFTYVPYSEIEDAPTIIETDKAESEREYEYY